MISSRLRLACHSQDHNWGTSWSSWSDMKAYSTTGICFFPHLCITEPVLYLRSMKWSRGLCRYSKRLSILRISPRASPWMGLIARRRTMKRHIAHANTSFTGRHAHGMPFLGPLGVSREDRRSSSFRFDCRPLHHYLNCASDLCPVDYPIPSDGY